jgi:hypothetical protein
MILCLPWSLCSSLWLLGKDHLLSPASKNCQTLALPLREEGKAVVLPAPQGPSYVTHYVLLSP